MEKKTVLYTYYKGKEVHNKPDSVSFKVPTTWLEKYLSEEFGETLNSFMNEYTYDDSEIIMSKAKSEGVFNYL